MYHQPKYSVIHAMVRSATAATLAGAATPQVTKAATSRAESRKTGGLVCVLR